MDVRAVPVRGLHQDARRVRLHLAAGSAHDPGDRGGPGGVLDQDHVRVERARLAVECLDLLTVACAADGERRALDAVEVERVQRLPGQQHHVVGDVDDVRDRALPGGHQPRLQPQRARSDLDVLEHARGEARAQVRALDDHVRAGDIARRFRGPRATAAAPAAAPVAACDLARDAVDRPGSPGRFGVISSSSTSVRDREHVASGIPGASAVGSSTMIPAWSVPSAELVLGEDHPVASRCRAASRLRASVPSGMTAPGRATATV